MKENETLTHHPNLLGWGGTWMYIMTHDVCRAVAKAEDMWQAPTPPFGRLTLLFYIVLRYISFVQRE